MRNLMLGVVAVLWLGLAHAATPRTIVLDVQNMTCPACSLTIETALGRVPGVASSKVDTKAGIVTVSFDADRATVETLARAVSQAGFPAKVHSGS